MNRKTRNSVFETNSSSSHSITVANGNLKYKSWTPYDNKIDLGTGEYGWEFETYSDAPTKLDYLALDIGSNPERRAMLEQLIKEHIGDVEVNWVMSGYIDHQSDGTCGELKTVQAMKDFVFCDDSILETGNDNC